MFRPREPPRKEGPIPATARAFSSVAGPNALLIPPLDRRGELVLDRRQLAANNDTLTQPFAISHRTDDLSRD